MSKFIDLVSVYLMTSTLPEGCAPAALLEETGEGLRRTQRFGAVHIHLGPEPPGGHHVGIRIGTMQTVVGEMPKVELVLMDPSGVVIEEAEPHGSKSDLPRVAADLALQFADEALYPELMAARGATGKREHPRVRYFNEQEAMMMGVALLANLSNGLARGQELAGTATPPTLERLRVVSARSANAGLLALAAEILSLWGDAKAVLALLQRGHDALPEDRRPRVARRLHGATRQARNGAELASVLIHLGSLPGPFAAENPPKYALSRWLQITGLRSYAKPDMLEDLKDALGTAWARLPGLGIALAKPAPEEQFASLLNACLPALAPLGATDEIRNLAKAARGQSSWRAAADALLDATARAAPLLTIEPWWRYVAIGRPGAPEARSLLEAAIAMSPRAALLHEILGLEHLCHRDFDAAFVQLTKAIELQPDSANAYNLRGATLSDQGTRLGDAIRDLDRAIELDPSVALTWSNRAKTRFRLREIDGALRDIDYALRLAPGDENSMVFRTSVLMDQQRYAEVVTAADQFATGKASPAVLIKRGTAKFHLGDLEGALADLDAAIALTPLEDGLFFRAQVHMALGSLDAAERDLTILIDSRVREERRNDCKELLAEIQARRLTSVTSKTSLPWWKKLLR